MKIVVQKWGAAWCPPCIALAKKETLEKFAAKHPEEVKVEIHDDAESGSAAWEKKADKMNIKNLPTLVWMFAGEELFRSSDVSAAGIEKQFARAVKAVGR